MTATEPKDDASLIVLERDVEKKRAVGAEMSLRCCAEEIVYNSAADDGSSSSLEQSIALLLLKLRCDALETCRLKMLMSCQSAAREDWTSHARGKAVAPGVFKSVSRFLGIATDSPKSQTA